MCVNGPKKKKKNDDPFDSASVRPVPKSENDFRSNHRRTGVAAPKFRTDGTDECFAYDWVAYDCVVLEFFDFVFLELLKPLLSDVSVQIQQCAAIALGRMVHHSEKFAEQVLNNDFLPILLRHIDKQTVS